MELNWNGNVRELKNACERLAVLSESSVIDGVDVFSVLDYKVKQVRGAGLEKQAGGKMTKVEIGRQIEPTRRDERYGQLDKATMTGETIHDLLKQGCGKKRIAGIYGIDRTTLWRRMKQLKMIKP